METTSINEIIRKSNKSQIERFMFSFRTLWKRFSFWLSFFFNWESSEIVSVRFESRFLNTFRFCGNRSNSISGCPSPWVTQNGQNFCAVTNLNRDSPKTNSNMDETNRKWVSVCFKKKKENLYNLFSHSVQKKLRYSAWSKLILYWLWY